TSLQFCFPLQHSCPSKGSQPSEVLGFVKWKPVEGIELRILLRTHGDGIDSIRVFLDDFHDLRRWKQISVTTMVIQFTSRLKLPLWSCSCREQIVYSCEG
ncbi:hypothetical protein LINPERPRIM_LOCUS16337, partial [Linum perenne]